MSPGATPPEVRAHAVAQIVDALAPAGARPAAREPLALALADGRIPLELGVLYQRADGLTLDSIDVFDLQDALEWSGTRELAREFPGAAVFGWDRAGYVFFIDAADSLHRGGGVVFAVDKVYLAPHTCVPCAPDLATFLAGTAAGETPWRGVRLLDEQVARLRELLRVRSDRVDTRPPLPGDRLFATVAARGVELTFGLAAFYGVVDGMRFVRTGLVIDGAGTLEPVLSTRRADGTFGAIWFGSVPRGPRLAVSAADWDRPSDLVLQLSDGADPVSAPAYGRLFDTLNGWLASDADNAP